MLQDVEGGHDVETAVQKRKLLSRGLNEISGPPFSSQPKGGDVQERLEKIQSYREPSPSGANRNEAANSASQIQKLEVLAVLNPKIEIFHREAASLFMMNSGLDPFFVARKG